MTLIAFDLDGTLTETLESIVTALNKTLLHFNLPQHSFDDVRKMIGFGAEQLIQKAVQSDSKEFINTLLQQFKKILSVEQQSVRLYSGIRELLDQLKAKGFKTAITSNKPQDTLMLLAKSLDIQVDHVIGVCEGTAPKPDKCMIDHSESSTRATRQSWWATPRSITKRP
ncbi:Phosphoglycolate_phosphatase [Hexamita inflata]|uniref:Phosphoglycolate_phosphatase n=1 Tax=Hexamita inflata TaxID=28002 RepID=A0ABP1GIU5_9EUKA